MFRDTIYLITDSQNKLRRERENDRFVLRAKNKAKVTMQIISKEVGNSIHHDYKIDLRNGNEIISIPQNFWIG